MTPNISGAPTSPESNSSPQSLEEKAMEEVIESRVQATLAKDPKADPQKIRENFRKLFGIASNVPKMQSQSHLEYKKNIEDGVESLLKEWRMLRMSKINKSEAEQEEIDRKMQQLEEDIAINRKAIEDREKLVNA